MKLWIDPYTFKELSPTRAGKDALTEQIAVRSRAMDWWGMFGFLPDPDPVLAKLGAGLEIYRNLLTDAHVWSCYDSRKSGALACEWDVMAGGDTPADKAAHELCCQVTEDLDTYQIINEMLDAPFFGMAPLEIVWAALDGRWVPARIDGKPPEWFVFSDENELRFLSLENQHEGEELPAGKFLLPRHHASYLNPYGERVLSRCFWPVAFKKGGLKFWAIFCEKFGMPWLVGKVPPGTGETDRNRLLDRLTAMVADAVAVINDDETIEMPESHSKSASADIYERLISTANREVSKAILGQTLSTELDQGGSLAATQGHLQVREDIVDKDKHMVRCALNELFALMTDFNFPDAAAPEFTWFEEDDVQSDRAERDARLKDQGVRFTAQYYQRVYNFEEGDFEIGAPQPDPAGGEFAEEDTTGDVADRYADRAQAQSAALLDDLLAPVRALVESASTLEEIRDGLIELYPDMDANGLGELIQQALSAAELAGRYEIMEGLS